MAETRYFQYDSEVFLSAYNAYAQYITDLEALNTKISDSIKQIDADWQTSAGDSFRDTYENEWEPVFKQYKGLLTFMQSCVNDAMTQFDPIVTEAQQITF